MRIFKDIRIIAMVILGVLIVLSGCGENQKWFRDRADDYKEAKSCPTIKIPECVNADSFSNEYTIPGH